MNKRRRMATSVLHLIFDYHLDRLFTVVQIDFSKWFHQKSDGLSSLKLKKIGKIFGGCGNY